MLTGGLAIGMAGGIGSYRVPVLLKLTDGTLLAFCEGRKF